MLGLALLVATCVVAARAAPGRGELLAALAFLPLCMLLSPITWKAHHAALLPLYCALVCAALAPRRRGLLVLLGAYFVVCGLASEELLGKQAKNLLQSLSIVTWFDVALLAAALRLAASARADERLAVDVELLEGAQRREVAGDALAIADDEHRQPLGADVAGR